MKQLAPALAALTLASTFASSAFADDATPPRVDVMREVRRPPSSVRPKIIIGGVAIFGLAYAASFAAASGWPDVPGAAWLKIPVIGPWMTLGKSSCAFNADNCVPLLTAEQLKTNPSCAEGDDSCHAKVIVRGVAFGLDGLLQLAGLGLIAEGIFMKTESSTAPKKPSLALGLPGGITMLPVPTINARYVGLGLVGSF
jgi:hypothetical protein